MWYHINTGDLEQNSEGVSKDKGKEHSGVQQEGDVGLRARLSSDFVANPDSIIHFNTSLKIVQKKRKEKRQIGKKARTKY